MNVYDFDKTIYRRDSSQAFYLWCLKRYPRMALRWPRLARAFVRQSRGRISRAALMECLYEYLRDVPDPRAEAERFWNAQIHPAHDWYRRIQRPDDVVISASPLFLVTPGARRMGIDGARVIASPLNPDTGRYEGERCHGEGKVKAFRAAYPHQEPEAFYSDSQSDAPMARLARRAYLVHGESVTDWPTD